MNAGDQPLGQAHYFGPTNRRRFALVHWPAGEVRGAAVICPPLAYEAVCAHASLRLLAERLASLGIAALRIDYDGTGNSSGSEGDGVSVDAWRQTIEDAIAELDAWGLECVHLVGLRFGAALASTVASADGAGVAGLVAWDAVTSGRRYARELQMLSASAGVRSLPDGQGISVAGTRLAADTVVDLKRINLQPVDVPCLVVLRSERDGSPEIPSGLLTEERNLPGTEAMLDTDVEVSVPATEIIDAIAEWIDHHTASSPTPIAAPHLVAESVEVIGASTLEHRARRIGPSQLFQIETVTQGQRPDRAVVLLNNGVAPMVGPGRAWVQLARHIAERGWSAVRFDLGGIGESPPHPGMPAADSYPAHGGLDLAEVIDGLRSDGVREVAVVGLCSGALIAFDGVVATPHLDVIIAINGRFDRPFFDARPYRRLRAAPHTNRYISIPLRKAPLFDFYARIPTFFWRALDVLRIARGPTHAIRRGVNDGRRVRLIFGEHELGLSALRRRGGKLFDDLLDDPLVTFSICPGLDHSMFDVDACAEVLDQVLGYLGDVWPPALSGTD